jgi:hypothetical protein
MATPSGDDESADRERSTKPPPAARRVRRHAGPDQPVGKWAHPDSERDEIWGDAVPDTTEQPRRDVPPHHGA